MILRNVISILFAAAVVGCQAQERNAASAYPEQQLAHAGAASDLSAGSLFPGDQAVLTNGQIDEILAVKVYPAEHGRIAVIRMGPRDPYWWVLGDVASMDQQTTDALLRRLRSSPRVSDALLLPSLLMPQQMTIAYLREAAARVQADSLLVYRVFTQNYQTSRWFAPDLTKAHCTVEALLLDTRRGIVMTTALATQNFTLSRSSGDVNLDETIARAQEKAAGEALAKVGDELLRYLNTAPPRQPATQPVAEVNAAAP